MPNIKELFVFDFDDTLAMTPSLIGIRRINKKNESDVNFKQWLRDFSLNFEAIDGENSAQELIWMNSQNFAAYEKAHRDDLDFLDSNNLRDEYDFSKTAGVDVANTEPVKSIISIAQGAYARPDAAVVIVTARSGEGNMSSMFGSKNKKITNTEDIQKFLNSQGLNISSGDVTTAGDIGSGPKAKADAVEKYIKSYNPEIVHFYDDSVNNIQAVIGLCGQTFPDIQIIAHQIGINGTIQNVSKCFESFERFLR